MMKNDFQSLLEQKSEDYEILSLEYQEMKELSQQIEKELEAEVEHLTKEKKKLVQENEKVQHQLQELKKKYTSETSYLEKKMDRLTAENEKVKDDLNMKSKLVIQSEIEIERLESQLRESQTVISDLESKIDHTLERLAMVQSQLELSKAHNEEEVQRLKDKIQESQSEALAYKAKELSNRSSSTKNHFEGLYMDAMSGHYQAYQGNGGDDPFPQKRRKLDSGRRVDEKSMYAVRERFEDEPTFHKPKKYGSRARNSVEDDLQNFYSLDMVNRGYSQSLLLVNEIIGDLKKDTSSSRKGAKGPRHGKQTKGKLDGHNVADLFAISCANLSMTSLI